MLRITVSASAMVSRLIDRKVASAISSTSVRHAAAARAADVGVLARFPWRVGRGAGFEQGDDVHQGRAAAIAGETVAAGRRPRPALHQAGSGKSVRQQPWRR